jgi:hypothetical protein
MRKKRKRRLLPDALGQKEGKNPDVISTFFNFTENRRNFGKIIVNVTCGFHFSRHVSFEMLFYF